MADSIWFRSHYSIANGIWYNDEVVRVHVCKYNQKLLHFGLGGNVMKILQFVKLPQDPY